MNIYDSCNLFHQSIIIQFGEIIYSSLKLNERTDEDILQLINKNNPNMESMFDDLKSNFEKMYQEKDREILKIQQESHNNYIKGFEGGKRVYNLIVDEKQKLIDKQKRDIEMLKLKEHLNTNQKGDEV